MVKAPELTKEKLRLRRDELHRAAEAAANGPSAEEHLGSESPKIVEDASKLGEKRLVRPPVGHAITSFAGGMSISFGAVAMASGAAAVGGSLAAPSLGHLIGALLFPIGFVILLIGKTELFTENFLIPVVAVIKRRGSMTQLGKLWGIALAFNLLGALVFGFLISRGHVLAPQIADEMIALAEKKASYDLQTGFVKAIFAGWLMTTLTWLLIASKGLGVQLALIWIIASTIVLGQFNHVVISASEIFMAMYLGADITLGAWLTSAFLPALAGNLVGGLVFVTLIHYMQSLFHQPVTDNASLDKAIKI